MITKHETTSELIEQTDVEERRLTPSERRMFWAATAFAGALVVCAIDGAWHIGAWVARVIWGVLQWVN